MSYLVFARKYRPKTFDDVVAQEHVTRTLRNALKNDRIGSAYLFCGPRGTGKTTVARILAKAINCVNGPTETPCGECPACREITAGSSMDVLEIDAASNTGVDDIRTLRENVRYLPTSGQKRIYIIDEVHRLSGSAFDALLKTLEEPPAHVMFMFATTEPLKVPETILSRTQRFDFRRVAADDLIDHLKNIAEKEKLDIDDAALALLARKADGSVRDSLSLMDQIAAFAGEKVSEEDVVKALGLVDRQFLFEFVNAVAAADRRKALHQIKGLFDAGVDVGDFVAELLEHLRTLMVISSDDNAVELLNLPEADLNEYRTQAREFSVGDLLRHMKILSDLNQDLKSGLDERLLLEIAAVKMAELETTVRFEDVLAQLQSPGSAGGETQGRPEGQPDMFGQKKSPESKPEEKPAAPKAPGRPAAFARSINHAQVKAGWDRFLGYLRGNRRMLASQLSMGELREVNDNEVLLMFSEAARPSMELVAKLENIKTITEALRDHYGANLTLKVDVDPDKKDPEDEADGKRRLKLDTKKLVDSSPRLQRILKLIDGEVIGVRKVE